jgi:hypothetical protein
MSRPCALDLSACAIQPRPKLAHAHNVHVHADPGVLFGRPAPPPGAHLPLCQLHRARRVAVHQQAVQHALRLGVGAGGLGRWAASESGGRQCGWAKMKASGAVRESRAHAVIPRACAAGRAAAGARGRACSVFATNGALCRHTALMPFTSRAPRPSSACAAVSNARPAYLRGHRGRRGGAEGPAGRAWALLIRARALTHVRAHTRTHAHTHTRTHAHTHTHTLARTRAHSHAHTHAHKQHTHTHAFSLSRAHTPARDQTHSPPPSPQPAC